MVVSKRIRNDLNDCFRLLCKAVSWPIPEMNEQNQEGSVRMADIVTKVAAGHLQTTTMHEFFVLPYTLRHCFISVACTRSTHDEVLWT
jgi:hypothetical protein